MYWQTQHTGLPQALKWESINQCLSFTLNVRWSSEQRSRLSKDVSNLKGLKDFPIRGSQISTGVKNPVDSWARSQCLWFSVARRTLFWETLLYSITHFRGNSFTEIVIIFTVRCDEDHHRTQMEKQMSAQGSWPTLTPSRRPYTSQKLFAGQYRLTEERLRHWVPWKTDYSGLPDLCGFQ